MSTFARIGLIALLLVIANLTLSIYPFLSGEYDQLAVPVATSIQIITGVGLLTVIPAIIWLVAVIHYHYSDQHTATKRFIRFAKFYSWTAFIIFLPALLLIGLGISLILGISLFSLAIFTLIFILTRVSRFEQEFSHVYIPLLLTLLPVLTLSCHILISKPLTEQCRLNAIQNSEQLIEEIERYHQANGTYPLTLNGLHRDFNTGIRGIDKYYYTYDTDTYHLYFEQPRFFFDQFGTREMVVYNPHDKHVILSHASWNLHFSPSQRASRQGWYVSFDTSVPHWKYFWFD